MVATFAWFLKIDGNQDCYNPRQLQAYLAFLAFVSNSGLFDGKHQRIHLASEMKKERFPFYSFLLMIVSRQRIFFRRMLDPYETEYPCEKEWWFQDK